MAFFQRIFILLTFAIAIDTVALAAETHTTHAARMPKPSESGFAHIDGISMFYQIYGHGDPILLIHGGLSSGEVWRQQLPALAARHKVIVADSRGQGRSTRTTETITYRLMAQDYIALLDQLGIARVSLVGWSDGGIIGLDIAIRHPERLNRMFVQAANATPDGVISHPDPSGAVTVPPELRHYDDVVDEIKALWANEPNFTHDELASIAVPTAIAIGEHDEAISMEHTEFLADTIHGAKFVLLTGVGHSAPVEDPTGYSRAVLDFIDGPSSAGQPSIQAFLTHRPSTDCCQ